MDHHVALSITSGDESKLGKLTEACCSQGLKVIGLVLEPLAPSLEDGFVPHIVVELPSMDDLVKLIDAAGAPVLLEGHRQELLLAEVQDQHQRVGLPDAFHFEVLEEVQQYGNCTRFPVPIMLDNCGHITMIGERLWTRLKEHTAKGGVQMHPDDKPELERAIFTSIKRHHEAGDLRLVDDGSHTYAVPAGIKIPDRCKLVDSPGCDGPHYWDEL